MSDVQCLYMSGVHGGGEGEYRSERLQRLGRRFPWMRWNPKTLEEEEVFGIEVLDFYRRGLTLLCGESVNGAEESCGRVSK